VNLLAPAPGVDLPACIAAYGTPAGVPGVDKDRHDLQRYAKALALSWPEVLVETGTRTGHSACWFADHGPEVVTVDIDPSCHSAPGRPDVARLTGDSTDPAVLDQVVALVAGRRCMVSLDSDHSCAHVMAEIRAYAPLVSPGCFLVVEDGIYHYVEGGYDGDPLQAISWVLPERGDFVRDLDIEGLYPVTGSPAGWWRRA